MSLLLALIGGAADAAATGPLAAVALAAPTGSASGTTVINGSASGAVAAVALAAPAGAAAGGVGAQDGDAAGVLAAVAVTPPGGGAQGGGDAPALAPAGGVAGHPMAPWRWVPFAPVHPRRPHKRRQAEVLFL